MDNPLPAAMPPSDAVFPPREMSSQAKHIDPITATTRPWGVIFAALAALLVLLGNFILYSGAVSTSARIRRAETSIAQMTAQLETQPLASVGQQANQLVTVVEGYDKAVSEQYDFTRLSGEVAKLLPGDVKVLSFSADAKGQFRSTLRAKNFIAAGKAILGLRQATHLNSVILETISFDPKANTEIDFSVLAAVDLPKLQGDAVLPTDQTAEPSLFAPGT